MSTLSADDVEHLTRLFMKFVEDLGRGNETLDIEDFTNLMYFCGYRYSQDELTNKFVQTDTDGDWQISLEEFLTKMAEVAPSGSPESMAAGIRYNFNSKDLNKDGFITVSELQQAMPELPFTAEGFADLIKEYDENGDGKIDFEEFVTLYLKTQVVDIDEDSDNVEETNQAVKETRDILVSADELRTKCKELEKDGYITADDMRECIAYVKIKLSDEQFEQCLQSLDDNGTGQYRYEEFVSLYEDMAMFTLENRTDDEEGFAQQATAEQEESPAVEAAQNEPEPAAVDISMDLEVDREELLNQPVDLEEPSERTVENLPPAVTNVKLTRDKWVNEEEDPKHRPVSGQNDTYVIKEANVVKDKKRVFEAGKVSNDTDKRTNPDVATCNQECKAGGISVRAMMAKFEQGKK